MLPNESERICKSNIEAHLGRPVHSGLQFMYSEGCVSTSELVLFHDMAQGFRQTTLQLNDIEELLFTIGVTRSEEESAGDIWRVTLASPKKREFLERYGRHYQIRPVGNKYYFTDGMGDQTVELAFNRTSPKFN